MYYNSHKMLNVHAQREDDSLLGVQAESSLKGMYQHFGGTAPSIFKGEEASHLPHSSALKI
jgi:hypothetical protein